MDSIVLAAISSIGKCYCFTGFMAMFFEELRTWEKIKLQFLSEWMVLDTP